MGNEWSLGMMSVIALAGHGQYFGNATAEVFTLQASCGQSNIARPEYCARAALHCLCCLQSRPWHTIAAHVSAVSQIHLGAMAIGCVQLSHPCWSQTKQTAACFQLDRCSHMTLHFFKLLTHDLALCHSVLSRFGVRGERFLQVVSVPRHDVWLLP